MSANGYLFYDGNCAEALSFYQQALGAEILLRVSYAQMPDASPPGWGDKIAFTHFTVLGSPLMASDAPPGLYTKPIGFRICLNVADRPQAETFCKALAEGGSVEMALAPTSWATLFAMVTDRFGIPWMISCAKPA